MRSFKRGFTLIELIITVAIIGIVSGIVIFADRDFASNTSRVRTGQDFAFAIRLVQSYSQSDELSTNFKNPADVALLVEFPATATDATDGVIEYTIHKEKVVGTDVTNTKLKNFFLPAEDATFKTFNFEDKLIQEDSFSVAKDKRNSILNFCGKVKGEEATKCIWKIGAIEEGKCPQGSVGVVGGGLTQKNVLVLFSPPNIDPTFILFEDADDVVTAKGVEVEDSYFCIGDHFNDWQVAVKVVGSGQVFARRSE